MTHQIQIRGADISHVKQIEEFGGQFFHNGKEEDILKILAGHGFNYIRLKVWNNPGPPETDPAGYNNIHHVAEMAQRIKKYGFRLLINFHYSDFWADPNKQRKPKAWERFSFDELTAAVHEFTAECIGLLHRNGVVPDMVQVGNEIDNGMLWDTGKLDGTEAQWDNFAALVKSGIRGVADGLPEKKHIPVMIHKADGCKPEEVLDFYDRLVSREVDFDRIGLSFYPYFHGTMAMLEKTLSGIADKYGKEIIIVETAWGWTDIKYTDVDYLIDSPRPESIPFSVEGQKEFLRRLGAVIGNVPGNLCRGLFYWEPAFIPVRGAGWKKDEGNEWANMTLFDFNGNALDSLDVFLEL